MRGAGRNFDFTVECVIGERYAIEGDGIGVGIPGVGVGRNERAVAGEIVGCRAF